MNRPPAQSKADVIFISYDGLLEPIGHSQVLSYLFLLADQGIRFEVVSFERELDLKDATQLKGLEKKLKVHAIRWTRLRYHKKPKVLSTIWDVARGALTTLRIARNSGVQLVHARSYVAALMSLPAQWLIGVRFLFDMRGFWPEERVELGIFRPGGILFRLSKFFERLFLRSADQLVVLTHRAEKILRQSPFWKHRQDRIEVIPCCVDTRRFTPREPNRELAAGYGLGDNLIVGNIGSINQRYLLNEMFRFFVHLQSRIPHLKFVYLTRQPAESLKTIAAAEGLKSEDLIVVSASPEEVPDWLSLFQLGVFFLKPSYAAQASSFTKLGEFLASGVPVVTHSGAGDVENLLGPEGVGVTLHDFSENAMTSATDRVAKMLPVGDELKDACRQVGADRFDLEKGVGRYLAIYRTLLSPSDNVIHELPRRHYEAQTP